MGIYADRVLPRLINVMCGLEQSNPIRQRVCAGLSGEVVEIGFGSGLNVPFYPSAVRRVAAIEPGHRGSVTDLKHGPREQVKVGSPCRTSSRRSA